MMISIAAHGGCVSCQFELEEIAPDAIRPPISQRSLERSVAAIAEDTTLAALAATKVDRLGFCGLELDRREACAGVAAITERLTLAQSTGTPVVAPACFNLNRIWTLLRDRRH
jgi:hypothetical protein